MRGVCLVLSSSRATCHGWSSTFVVKYGRRLGAFYRCGIRCKTFDGCGQDEDLVYELCSRPSAVIAFRAGIAVVHRRASKATGSAVHVAQSIGEGMLSVVVFRVGWWRRFVRSPQCEGAVNENTADGRNPGVCTLSSQSLSTREAAPTFRLSEMKIRESETCGLGSTSAFEFCRKLRRFESCF